MQTIYTLSTLEGAAKPGEPVKLLRRHFDQSKELLVYLTHLLSEVAGYAETDSYNRSSKHLPSTEDLNVNTKIAGNEWLWKIREEESFVQEKAALKPEQRIDREVVRRSYHRLLETPEYQEYIRTPERNAQSERAILEFILNDLLLPDEDVTSHLEEAFINWDDDADMVIQLLRAYLHKPGSSDMRVFISPDKWEFARTLLTTVAEKEEHILTYIIPRLRNWDPERIAALDMIIMKMGVAEFLYFETIPPKVTINEYIDIAKEYSTQQSGQFVNGILDNIHKDLVQEGKLQKKDFKKAQ